MLGHFYWADGSEQSKGSFAVRLNHRHDRGNVATMLGEEHCFGGMNDGSKDTASLAAKFGESGVHLCEKYILFRIDQALPAHADYQMRHREAIQHQAEKGGHSGAGGNDPEGGQEGEGLGG
jgi:hypothetical protein